MTVCPIGRLVAMLLAALVISGCSVGQEQDSSSSDSGEAANIPFEYAELPDEEHVCNLLASTEAKRLCLIGDKYRPNDIEQAVKLACQPAPGNHRITSSYGLKRRCSSNVRVGEISVVDAIGARQEAAYLKIAELESKKWSGNLSEDDQMIFDAEISITDGRLSYEVYNDPLHSDKCRAYSPYSNMNEYKPSLPPVKSPVMHTGYFFYQDVCDRKALHDNVVMLSTEPPDSDMILFPTQRSVVFYRMAIARTNRFGEVREASRKIHRNRLRWLSFEEICSFGDYWMIGNIKFPCLPYKWKYRPDLDFLFTGTGVPMIDRTLTLVQLRRNLFKDPNSLFVRND
jgi:hypothetical protein